MVEWVIDNARSGEIFVPKIPSYRIVDVAEAIAPSLPKKKVGVRPGEKIHEEMITSSDSFSTIDMGKYYAILSTESKIAQIYGDEFPLVPRGFSYNSFNNSCYLTVEEIRDLIVENVDSSFQPL